MERSPCRGCIYEFEPKIDCYRRCDRLGKAQQLSHQVFLNSTRSDFAHNTSHTLDFPS